MASHNYHQVIPTHVHKKYIEFRLAAISNAIFSAKDDQQLYELKGQGMLLRELLNLPEILIGLEGGKDGHNDGVS